MKKQKNCFKKEKGIVFLEATIWLTILCIFILTAFALVQHIQRQKFVEYLLEKNVRATSLRAYTLSENFVLVVNDLDILNFISDLLLRINEEINNFVGVDAKRFIEIVQAEVKVDSYTGEAHYPVIIKQRVVFGENSFISKEVSETMAIESVLNNKINSFVTDSGVFLYATPLFSRQAAFANELFSAAGTAPEIKQYAPSSVFIAVNVFFMKNDKSLMALLKRYLMLDPVYYSSKIVNLRGDFDI